MEQRATDPYAAWGFAANPFNTRALPASEEGRQLLVGRDSVLAAFRRRLRSAPKHPTIEGPNGIGKTSLVNVGCYSELQTFIETGEGPLFVLCRVNFQLTSDQPTLDFVDGVYFEIAQTLVSMAKEIDGDRFTHLRERVAPIDAWLNSPHLRSLQVAIGPVGAGYSREQNTGVGFERSGLRRLVRHLLEEVFPSPDLGAIVCVIDNLELVQTSQKARQLLEELRDDLLVVPGLRWVLCGALGIVLGVAETPRLEGVLHAPISVGELDTKDAPAILESRVKAYRQQGVVAALPLAEAGFRALYEVLRGNLRSVLSFADTYCQAVADRLSPERVRALDDEAKKVMFNDWLSEMSHRYLADVRENLRPRAWEIFEAAVTIGGAFSPSDYREFGAESMQALRPHVKDLEDVGLLRSVIDESDRRRKTIRVQPKGWFVHYAMASASGGGVSATPS